MIPYIYVTLNCIFILLFLTRIAVHNRTHWFWGFVSASGGVDKCAHQSKQSAPGCLGSPTSIKQVYFSFMSLNKLSCCVYSVIHSGLDITLYTSRSKPKNYSFLILSTPLHDELYHEGQSWCMVSIPWILSPDKMDTLQSNTMI